MSTIQTATEALIRLAKQAIHQDAVLVYGLFEVQCTPSVILQGPNLTEDRFRRNQTRQFEKNTADLSFEECRFPRLYHLKVLHKNKKNRKEYFTYKLVESVRTERGPRQRDVLNLGASFNLPAEQWKDFANYIETELTGQRPLFDYPKKFRALARKYARAIIHQRSEAIDERRDIPADYQVVDVNSVDSEDVRTVGAEHVVYETIKELGLDRKLTSFGFTSMQLSLALGMIAGRMIFPGSERATHQKKKAIPPSVTMVAVKRNDEGDVLVEAGLCNNPDTDELELYCHSVDKEAKEEGIKNRFQSRLESDLRTARSALNKKYGTAKDIKWSHSNY